LEGSPLPEYTMARFTPFEKSRFVAEDAMSLLTGVARAIWHVHCEQNWNRRTSRLTQSPMLSRQVLRRLPSATRATRPLLVPQRNLATAQSPSPNDPFANGTNAYYAEQMYRRWRQDPKSVHASWDVYFSGMDKGLPSSQAFHPPPKYLPNPSDGAPALHVGAGAELDDHLKVCRTDPLCGEMV